MSNNDSRVLSRRGARELTLSESEMVSGAFNTDVCTLAFNIRTQTTTGAGDGDGCHDTDFDA